MVNYIQILAEKENFSGEIMVSLKIIYFHLDDIFIFCVDQDDDSFKKPLFSDSEDENVILNDDDGDDLSGLWRKERYKRESYLSQVLLFNT